jgi:hypothetical protein
MEDNNCPDCLKPIQPEVYGNVHCKTWCWKCPVHGAFKTQQIVDGEVIREWVRDVSK